MKKFLLLAAAAIMSVSAMAELAGNGYYRVQNAITKRYAYLLDNRGSFDAQTTSADVHALHLYSGFVKASSDPASVFYIDNVQGSNYNISGQGTSLYGFLGEYLKIIKGKSIDNVQSYYAYASKSGFTKYLGDIRSDMSEERGYPSVDAKGDDRLWYIDAISVSGDQNYFGIAPTVTAGSKYYYPFYAGFPYAAYSSGVKFYVVSRIEPEYGVVVISELVGNVPSGTPVIVECEHPLPTDNRLTIGPSGSVASLPANYLRGVYFDNDMKTHYNRTAYDKNTMRSLSSVNGKLTFVKGDYDFVPRNEAYLLLPDAASRAVDQYSVMTVDEFNAYVSQLSSMNPDGYYRVQNARTGRYAYLLDNKGNASDASAIQTIYNVTKLNSDPSAVFYVSKPSGSGVFTRNLSAQASSLQSIFGNAPELKPSAVVDDKQAFTIFTGNGYLGDVVSYANKGQVSVGEIGEASDWWLQSVKEDSDSYFGIAPTLTAGGKYYQPFMADFPVSACSDGVKFHVVTKINPELEVMVLKQVEGVVPAGTPVIVECANPLASDNRLVVGAQGSYADMSGNLLRAVYYDISEYGHSNRVPYDAKNMRSLTSVDGKLVFSVSSSQFVPRNEAYIALSGDAQTSVDSYSVMTPEEYDAYVASLRTVMPDGYYRMQNVATGRTVVMIDDKGGADASGNFDFGAFGLSGDSGKVVSDPASVFSFSARTSTDVPIWVVSSQDVSAAAVLGTNIKLLPVGEIDGKPAFDAYILTRAGAKVHLSDIASGNETLVASGKNTNSLWWLTPVDEQSEENYIGITPSMEANDKYYHTFMSGFPFEPYSSGMKTYIVVKIDDANKQLVRREVSGTIAPGVPVIFECESPLAADNRLKIGIGDNVAATGFNLMKAVWFDNKAQGHVNNTPFDKSAMRLMSAADDKLKFVKADNDVVPRNTAYILLGNEQECAVDEYELLTEDEYYGSHGVNAIPEDALVDVYHVDGSVVMTSVTKSEVKNLPAGLYLIRSGEVCEKCFVN
ncbi:MAG: hypothetical protein NC095_01680 [Muribaculum sp.]|nr:hypothetical protein [Muribaculum sp.]